MDDMKDIAGEHDSRNSIQVLMEAAQTISAGGKVMSGMLAYNTFFADQLESEKDDCEYVLGMLKVQDKIT